MTGGLNPAAVSLVKLRTGIHDPERAAIAIAIAGRTAIAWPADDTAASAPAVNFLTGRVMSIDRGRDQIQRELGREPPPCPQPEPSVAGHTPYRQHRGTAQH